MGWVYATAIGLTVINLHNFVYFGGVVCSSDGDMIQQLLDKVIQWQVTIRAYLGLISSEEEAAAEARNNALVDAYEEYLIGQKVARKLARIYAGKIADFSVFILNEAWSPDLVKARADDVADYWLSDYEPFDGETDLDYLLGAIDSFFEFMVEAGYVRKHVYRDVQKIIEEHEAWLYRRAARRDR